MNTLDNKRTVHNSVTRCRAAPMPEETLFYVDDSGPRDPDRRPKDVPPPRDWFALGGILIDASREAEAKSQIKAFRQHWPEMKDEALRSYDIRNKTDRFRWLAGASALRQQDFMKDLTSLIVGLPIHVLASVVDRPGYNRRYMQQYGQRRWRLCRTAFAIAVERAAKVAISRGNRLRVYCERSDREAEAHFKGYFDEMRNVGLPFNPANSQQYRPLDQPELHRTLFEFRIKTKDSALMQIADLVLWPVCQGGYDRTNRAYVALAEAGKLIETQCTLENGLLGSKYSCFDQAPETQEPADAGSWRPPLSGG